MVRSEEPFLAAEIFSPHFHQSPVDGIPLRGRQCLQHGRIGCFDWFKHGAVIPALHAIQLRVKERPPANLEALPPQVQRQGRLTFWAALPVIGHFSIRVNSDTVTRLTLLYTGFVPSLVNV